MKKEDRGLTYFFATGECTKVEVSKEWEKVLAELADAEWNNARRFWRRVSFEAIRGEAEGPVEAVEYGDPRVDVAEEGIRGVSREALGLTPVEWELVKLLELGWLPKDIAELRGVSRASVSQMIKRLRKKFSEKNI